MLKNSKAFSGFSVKDLQEARSFYSEKLGIEVESVPGMEDYIIRLKTPGCNFMIYAKENHQPATFTVLNFPVDDIEKAVDGLTAKGVKFEHYTEEPLKTNEKGISHSEDMSIAWFTDPSGNIHSLIQDKK